MTVKNKYRHNDKDNDDDTLFPSMYKDLHDMWIEDKKY